MATSFWQPFTAPAFGLYTLAAGIEAVRVGRKAGLLAIPIVWTIFPVLHVSHGLGFAAGLWKYVRHPDWSSPTFLGAHRRGSGLTTPGGRTTVPS